MQETWVRSLGQEDPPGEENGNPLQYYCLEKSMDRGAWQATVHGVANSRTGLSDSHTKVTLQFGGNTINYCLTYFPILSFNVQQCFVVFRCCHRLLTGL